MMPPLRCQQPGVTRAGLNAFIERHEEHFADLTDYTVHLSWLIARYSRGDELTDLAGRFDDVVASVVASDALDRAKSGTNDSLFTHRGRYAGLFRDALVLLSIALGLRVPPSAAKQLLACCERGDALLEAVGAAATKQDMRNGGTTTFPRFFDGLYAALHASPQDRPKRIADYLEVWRNERVADFGFILAHESIGYWCFEAAGVVIALNIDDATFADHPHYPRDLVAFAREAGSR
jgi:hypothetical protein